MKQVISYSQCPVCGSRDIEQVLRAKDYTVSGEIFAIYHCNQCTVRFTQDVPAAAEINAYYQSADYISHSDTRQGLINSLYHLVRNYTLGSKRRLAEKISGKKSGALLDIGAGTGAFAATMQQSGWKVTGLEPDDTARANAQKNYHLQLKTLDSLFALDNDSYDIITLWHVLEHVHELDAYLGKFRDLLKKDGALIVAVPNYTSGDARHYKEYWAAYDVPRHLYHFSPESVRILMDRHGFLVTDYRPMWFDSFYISMLSEQYKRGKPGLLKAAWNGFSSNLRSLSNIKKCSSVIYIMRKAK